MTGISLGQARSQGWLFDVEFPDQVDFYRVWSVQDFGAVRWDFVFSFDFLTTTVQVFFMGFLTTTNNIYGTAEFTGCSIDVDREICVAGIQSLLCGLAGGLPGNIVMSFSITAHRLGGRTWKFSALLVALSIGFFMVGDYAIAILPRMVPAGMLFWLGLVLVVSWIWDLVGSMSASEHGIVILMIVLNCVWGPGPMMLAGLFLTFILSTKRTMTMKPITS